MVYVNGVNTDEVDHPDNALTYDGVRADSIKLTPEEQEVVKKKMKALNLLLVHGDKIKAKYKIEVRFGKKRYTQNPTPGIMSWWESGKKFKGGGDEKLYLCPGKRLERNNCEAPLPEAGDAPGRKICPTCGTVWMKDDVIGELAFNLTMQNWARAILNHYLKLEQHCDVVLKHSADDIRSIIIDKKPSWDRSETLDRARAKRAVHIYPLRNIIVDTSNGADLLGRFHAFLTS